MSNHEHARDAISGESSAEIMRRRLDAGWRMTAIEWERERPGGQDGSAIEPVPFGLRVARDCRNLEQDPVEHEILMTIAEMLIRDERMPVIAASLNTRGYRTRDGEAWSPTAVFNLMPRVVEASPKMFASSAWPQRRARYTE
jgi:hypothetical protein